ncbi:M28 family peptidase [Chitinophaga sp. GCM10012297]|uniref:M28 family peptidase n=1 Tax=Chitinophaga chungangae TaxID=2821488 RepID=A0ABS3YE10_9BACT|nr:M28 family peptidase [Chitinophaga chungangae]MBO9152917.1 M28 family peptidase [Chitinophaga chungangae]
MKKTYLLLPLVCIALAAYPQKKADRKTLGNLQTHITYLSSDKLEGRRTGTAGEQLAATYIAEQMKLAGVSPKGDSEYLQTFTVREGREAGDKTRLLINHKPLPAGQYLPLPFSASKAAKGEVLPGVNEPDNVWLINVKASEDEINPHAEPLEFYIKKTKEAKQSGATGIVFFNGPEDARTVTRWLDGKEAAELPIPAVWVGPEASKILSADDANGFQLDLEVDFKPSKRTGTNVVGYIDNGAATIVVLGAHYDHLGYGEDHNSLAPGEKAIHNGADDNASGTAALIELGRLLKASKLKNNNYLLVAFSGEELGLFGSKYFTEHATVPMTAVNYMVNMDMVGRLAPEKGLQIGGTGTSPVWGGVLKSVVPSSLKVSYDSSGTGPSDHTSFYRKDVPVLFFFTGTHADYHKPGDDVDKINYEGGLTVVKLVYDIIEKTNGQPKLAFTKTREQQMGSSARFSVTLGIMPDYTWTKGGVKVDGVSDGKPAKKAGILTGDLITQLGDYPVSDIETYMSALGKFKAGDKTTVTVKRGETDKVFDISF